MLLPSAKRVVAFVLAAAVVLGAPGVASYEAAAQVARVPAASEGGLARPGAALALPSFAPSLPSASSLLPSLAPSAAFTAAPAAAAPAAAPAAAAPAAAAPAVAAVPVAAPALRPAARAAGTPSAARRDDVGAQVSEGRRLFDQALVRPADADAAAVLAAPSDGPERAPELKPSAPEPAPETKKIPRPLWGFFWGHDIATVLGINFHILSQPFLVQNTLGMGTATMGFVRNIHMGAMAIVNFLPIGYLIDKTDFRVVSITTALVRALLMGAIPLLWMAGGLHFTVLAAIVAFNPLFQSTMIVAEGAAMKTILGKDEKLNKEATATFSKWDAVAGMAMPLIAGWAVGALVSGFGLGGYALAYGLYAGLLLVSIPIYWFTVRDPRFPGKLGAVQAASQGAAFLGALLHSMVYPFWALLKSLKHLRSLPAALRAARAGAGGGLSGLADLLDRYKPMEGLAFILRNKTLRVLTGVMALEVLLSDALPFVLLPNLITEALGTAPAWMPAAFASAGGLMGLLFSIEYLGRFIPSLRLEGDKGDAIIERVGHGAFYRRAGVASLLFWALLAPLFLTTGLFWANLAIVAGVMFGVQYFNTPVGIVLAPVKRAQMDDDKLARIESAVFMVDVAFESIGALLIGLLMDFAGLKVALIATAAFLSLTGILQYKVPSWIFPDGERPEKKNP